MHSSVNKQLYSWRVRTHFEDVSLSSQRQPTDGFNRRQLRSVDIWSPWCGKKHVTSFVWYVLDSLFCVCFLRA